MTMSQSTSVTTPAAAAPDPLVRVDGVTRIYRLGMREVHALRGLDLSVGRFNRYVANRVVPGHAHRCPPPDLMLQLSASIELKRAYRAS